MGLRTLAIAAAVGLAWTVPAGAQERWDKDLGEPAPRLFAAGWVGTPVSLEALRRADATPAPEADPGSTVARPSAAPAGNTVVLAFWNADIPC